MPGEEEARGAVAQGGPEEVRRVEERHAAEAEDDGLQLRVVVERDGPGLHLELPRRVVPLAGGHGPVADLERPRARLREGRPPDEDARPSSAFPSVRMPVLSVRSSSRRSPVQARRSLLEDDVPLGHDDLRLRVGPHVVGRQADVLVLDRDDAPLRRLDLVDGLGEEALPPSLPVGDAHLDDAPRFRRPELDVEVRPLAEARGEGVGLEGGLRRAGARREGAAPRRAPRGGLAAAAGPPGGALRVRASSRERRRGPRGAARSPPRSPRR